MVVCKAACRVGRLKIMAFYDNYDEWISAMRLQLHAGMLGQLILQFHKDCGRIPQESEIKKMGDLVSDAVDIWERTTAP